MAEYGLNSTQIHTLQDALLAMTNFNQVFGRSLDKSVVAELLVANQLNLKIVDQVNHPGYDAIDRNRQRYQIKYRAEGTLNVDVNNFDFDYLILVNLDENYQLIGLWQLIKSRAEELFIYRNEFRKYQATQRNIKRNSQRIV